MNIDTLSKLLKTAPQVFVWVPLNPEKGVWLQIAKSTVLEYLAQTDDVPAEVHVSIDDNLCLYLGMPYGEDDLDDEN